MLSVVRNVLIGFISTLVFGGAVGYFFGYDHGFERAEEAGISSFEECKAAGYPIMESYPEQCATPDGKHFTRDISDERAEDVDDDTEESTPVPPSGGVRPINPGDAIACPMDAKICPDGSGVGRTGPNCEFAPCPGE